MSWLAGDATALSVGGPLLLAAGTAVEAMMLKVLVQLIVIVLAARLLGTVARALGQPVVVGEIVGGLALGPSLLGKFFPQTFSYVFDPSVAQIFQALAQLGLIFLLFLIGLEFDFSHLKQKGKAAWMISWAGIILPFGLGYLLGLWLHPRLAPDVPRLGFCLFIGTAMSITAIPILGRIMMELNITRSAVGAITISAAAFDDATGWIILATVAALVKSGFDMMLTLKMVVLTAVFCAAMIWLVRPMLLRLLDMWLGQRGELSLWAFAGVLVVLFACAIATNLIGIYSIFGAFILGAVMSDHTAFRQWATRNLSQFVTVFFLPIFFTFTGLRTDAGSLTSVEHWVFALLVLGVAVFGKFGGCTFAARASGFTWRESGCIGVMMNTRALMELIVINIGHDLGVVPQSLFVMLVFMAVITTIMTTPILLGLSRGTSLEPLIAQSSFGRKGDDVPNGATTA